jgi:signal recognition particle subunit SRP54
MPDFDFNDFLEQFETMRRMRPLDALLNMLPIPEGMSKAEFQERQINRTEAMVRAMTFDERTKPDIVDTPRRQRIANESGCTVAEVDDLINRFNKMKKMLKQMPRLRPLGDDESREGASA